jgi:hypothetical protein
MTQTVVDSKQEPLPAPTVISMALGETDLGRVTPAAGLAGIAKELTMDNVDILQVGNTVFIGHRGKGKNKDLMWGRAINVDTAQNFINNGLRYLTHLQRIGIKRYVAEYKGDTLDNAFRVWKRYADKADTTVAVGRLSDGNSKAFITLGDIPLTKAA